MTEAKKPKWLGLDEENSKLMSLLVKKTENIESPLALSQLACDLRDHIGSPSPATTFIDRIRARKSKIEEEQAYDDETKVKLIFGLSASISEEYLREISKDAIVRVDERKRIIKYQRKDGEFELRGQHLYQDPLTRFERTEKIWEFLAEKAETATSPMCHTILAREYKETTGSHENEITWNSRFSEAISKIYRSPYVRQTRIRMMFMTSCKLSENQLKRYRERAEIEVDSKNRIIKYKANDGSVELTGDHSMKVKQRQGKEDVRRRSKLMNNDQNEEEESDGERMDDEEAIRVVNQMTANVKQEKQDTNSSQRKRRSQDNDPEVERKVVQGLTQEKRKSLPRSERFVGSYNEDSAGSENKEIDSEDSDEEDTEETENRLKKAQTAANSLSVNPERKDESPLPKTSVKNQLETPNAKVPVLPMSKETADATKISAGNLPITASGGSKNLTTSVKKVNETPRSRRLPDPKYDKTLKGLSDYSESEEEAEESEEKEDDSDSEELPDSDKEKADGVIDGSREEILKSFTRNVKSSEKSAEARIANSVNQKIANRLKEITEQSKSRENATIVGDHSQKKKDSNGMTEQTVEEVDKENTSSVTAKEVSSETSMLKENSQNPAVAPNSRNYDSNSKGSTGHADNEKELPSQNTTVQPSVQQNTTTTKDQLETPKAPVSETTETDAVSEISAEKSPESAPGESRDLVTPKMPRGDLKRKIGEKDEVDPSKRAKNGEDSGEIPKETEVQNTIPTSTSAGNQVSSDSMKVSISSRSVLKWLKEFVKCLYSKDFEGFQKTLEKEADELSEQNLSVCDITHFIGTFLVLVRKPTSSTTQSLNVRDLLTKLKITLYIMRTVDFSDLQRNIDEMIAEIDGNTMVPTQMVLLNFSTIYFYIKHSS